MNHFGDNPATKDVGIIGGLGPETTSEFYLNLIKKLRKHSDSYPKIIIDSISFPFSLEQEIIFESRNEHKILPALKDGIRRLNQTEVDFIVIPCNTVHIFIGELRRESSVPIMSIIEETIEFVKRKNYRTVGLLATKKTVDSKLYENPMKKDGINVILPNEKEQDELARIIVEILRGTVTEDDRGAVKRIAKELIKRGSGAIVLGCTDLQIILNNSEVDVELLDSFEILLESTFRKMIEVI